MSASTYLMRYRMGERKAVWGELLSLGATALAEPLLSDARAVAEEIVDRAHHNLRLLRDRLIALGYRFERPEEVIVDAAERDRAAVIDLELSMGTLPLIVRTWYQRIASVDFRQHPDQLFYRQTLSADCADLPVVGLGLHVPLVFLRIERCLELRDQMIARCAASQVPSRSFEKFFPVGGYASNCDPKGLALPSQGIDGTLYNDGDGNICFVDELRKAFCSGGFPFWRRKAQYRRGVALIGRRPDFRQLLDSLVDGLQTV